MHLKLNYVETSEEIDRIQNNNHTHTWQPATELTVDVQQKLKFSPPFQMQIDMDLQKNFGKKYDRVSIQGNEAKSNTTSLGEQTLGTN